PMPTVTPSRELPEPIRWAWVSERRAGRPPARRSGAGGGPSGAGGGRGWGGAAAGAASGAVGGPVGSAVGAVVGGVAGGLAGKGAAEAVNPTVEDTYWRQNYSTRPYVTTGATYDTYQPAYRY